MIVVALAISWAGFVAGMGWFYLRTPARPHNRRTHRLARFLSVSPSLTQPRNPHA